MQQTFRIRMMKMLPPMAGEIPFYKKQALSFPWSACQLYQVGLKIMTEIYT
jgi:hypothetical protein